MRIFWSIESKKCVAGLEVVSAGSAGRDRAARARSRSSLHATSSRAPPPPRYLLRWARPHCDHSSCSCSTLPIVCCFDTRAKRTWGSRREKSSSSESTSMSGVCGGRRARARRRAVRGRARVLRGADSCGSAPLRPRAPRYCRRRRRPRRTPAIDPSTLRPPALHPYYTWPPAHTDTILSILQINFWKFFFYSYLSFKLVVGRNFENESILKTF